MGPERVGDWVIDGVLATGGMAVIYQARPAGGGPDVAVKIVDAAVCTDEARRRFRREGNAVMALDHPNVVRVLGFGEGARGPYLAMELLEGEDLSARLRRGPLEAGELVRVGVAAAAGLGHAHAAGIVHRDVKPANLFLCRDGGVKVLDFGLAVSIADRAVQRVTLSGLVAGTPAYMAAEQAMGLFDEDARTDVWGLGATLYRAATGRSPFHAPSPTAQLVRIIQDDPDPLPPTVPRWLGDVLLRAMRKERVHRWASMSAFAAALASARETAEAGSTLEETVAVRQPAPPLADEVRIVSILLAEGVRDLLTFEDIVKGELGRSWSLVGSSAVGVFGRDAWTGDEAERAVRAGIALRASASPARLAVATGRAVRTQRGQVTGAVVASAETVLSAEGLGIDEETARRVRGAFAVEGTVVTGPKPPGASSNEPAALAPIVGREEELRALQQVLEGVREPSRAAAILVVGPPGIGKTRLCHEVVARLDPTWLVLEGRGEAHRSLHGWHALGGAIRRLAGVPEGTDPAIAQESLLRLCPSRESAELLGEILGAPFPATAHLQAARSVAGLMRERVLLSIGELFEALLAEEPLLLVMEDLQWADAPSIEGLEVLLRRLSDRPLMVLANARPEIAVTLRSFERLALAGIGRMDMRQIVRGALGPGDWRTVADAIHDRSGGNPYFAQQIALALGEGRQELPASVEAAVQARLDALPRPEKDLLRRASVLGGRFWVEAVAAMGEHDPETLLGRLHRRDMVSPEAPSRLSDTREWCFAHTLLAEVSYASLTDDQRPALHLAAGRWLAARHDAPEAEVARHLARGGAADEAAPHWLAAAHRAAREGDTPLALEASEHALERPIEEAAAFRLRLLRVDLLHHLGDMPGEDLELEALARLGGAPAALAEVEERRARGLRMRGRYDEAHEAILAGLRQVPDFLPLLVELVYVEAELGRGASALEHATTILRVARASGDGLAVGSAHRAMSRAHASLADLVSFAASVRESIPAFEAAGDPRMVAHAKGALGYAYLQVARHADAAKLLEEACQISIASGSRGAEGYALHNLGLALARLGDAAAGLAAEDAALLIAEETGNHRLRMGCLEYRATILLESGRAAEAIPDMEEALRVPEDRQGNYAPELRAVYAAALLAVGRHDEARCEVDRALALRDAAGMEENEVLLLSTAHLLGVEGALETGLRLLMAKADALGDPVLRRGFLEATPAHAALLALAEERDLDR